LQEGVKKLEQGCTNDACLPVKKTVLATKEVIEEFFLKMKKEYPNLVIEPTFTEENGKITPKVGIFPSSIIRFPAEKGLPQPLKVMIFINVLNAQDKEVELSAGWTFGPGAEEEKEEIYVKLLDVVFTLKQEKGPLYRGKLDKEAIQPKVENFFANTLEEYKEIIESLDL